MRKLSLLGALLSLFTMSNVALAGGYDTPILYSARHMGMGGTAVSYVDDPSSLFHNPAGLGKSRKLTLMGDFSLLVGGLQGAPASAADRKFWKDSIAAGDDLTLDSETTIAPFFLVGASGKLTDWLGVGFAVYPVASAGATYKYGTFEDKTQLIFIEASPGLAFNLWDDRIRIGASYRFTYVNLQRTSPSHLAGGVDFSATGTNFKGFRLGLQFQPIKQLQIGLAYRHKTTTTVKDKEGKVGLGATSSINEISTDFTLPSRLSFGARIDEGPVGLSFDVEYAFNSQVTKSGVYGIVGPNAALDNVSNWDDAFTFRVGAEYRLLNGRLPIRIGFIYDDKTAQRATPSAFGTPPAATYSGTIGAGWVMEDWQVNVAYAYRAGSASGITADEVSGNGCAFCGQAGDYSIGISGFYIDFSYSFGDVDPYGANDGLAALVGKENEI